MVLSCVFTGSQITYRMAPTHALGGSENGVIFSRRSLYAGNKRSLIFTNHQIG